MNEIWKPIPNYEGLYEISNLGRVKSLERTCKHCGPRVHKHTRIVKERMIKFTINHKGYYLVRLYKDGVQATFAVARLVAKIFIPNPDNKPQVDHIDNDKTNNRIDNLRWVTNHENMTNEITVARRSFKAKGKWHGPEHKSGAESPTARPIVMINPVTKQTTFFGCMEETRAIGFTPSNVSKCCRGLLKHHKGMSFMYVENYQV